jgi:hypothetical protein
VVVESVPTHPALVEVYTDDENLVAVRDDCHQSHEKAVVVVVTRRVAAHAVGRPAASASGQPLQECGFVTGGRQVGISREPAGRAVGAKDKVLVLSPVAAGMLAKLPAI